MSQTDMDRALDAVRRAARSEALMHAPTITTFMGYTPGEIAAMAELIRQAADALRPFAELGARLNSAKPDVPITECFFRAPGVQSLNAAHLLRAMTWMEKASGSDNPFPRFDDAEPTQPKRETDMSRTRRLMALATGVLAQARSYCPPKLAMTIDALLYHGTLVAPVPEGYNRWGGGKMIPEGGEVQVVYILRNGGTAGPLQAKYLDWDHAPKPPGNLLDIVAYQVQP